MCEGECHDSSIVGCQATNDDGGGISGISGIGSSGISAISTSAAAAAAGFRADGARGRLSRPGVEWKLSS